MPNPTPPSTESELLRILRDAEHTYVSGEQISKKLNVTRSALWKHVSNLRQSGYTINASTKRGYKFVSAPDLLLCDEIQAHLDTSFIGSQILTYETIDSTNRAALQFGEQGLKEGLVICAESQTKGRGRLGRAWASPKGKGIYLSILLRPKLEIREIAKITLATAVTVCSAIAAETGVQAQIRWPNDVLVGDKKLCGILTEISAEADRVKHLVVGVGINVNSTAEDLPPVGTSVHLVTGKAWNRARLAARFLNEFEKTYKALQKGKFAEIVRDWESLSVLSGKNVVAKGLNGDIEGVAMGIDEEDGALWIRRDTGIQTKVLSGDIQFIR